MVKLSVRRVYILIMLISGVLSLLVILFYNGILLNITRTSTGENFDFITQEITRNLNIYFSEFNTNADLISLDDNVASFLMAPNSRAAYKIGEPVQELMKNIFTNSQTISSAVLFTNEGSFYRYESGFTNATCELLFNRFNSDSYEQVYTREEIEGQSYFCLSQSIYSISAAKPEKAGLLLLMASANDAHSFLESVNALSGFTVALSDHAGTIFLSNNHPIEGLIIDDIDAFDGRDNDVEMAPVKGSNLRLYVARNQDALHAYRNVFMLLITMILLAMAFVFVFTTFAVNKIFINPITNVILQMRNKGVSNIKERLNNTGRPDIDRLVDDINALLQRTEEYSRRVFNTQKTLYESELKKQKLQLYVLRKQINTHFIFNTLNSIKALANENSQRPIAEISEGLAKLLRYSYSTAEYINIFDEMQVIREYIRIMNIRFKNKFEVDYDVDDQLCNYVILRLILQPIVENALMHGLEKKIENCHLSIGGRYESDAVVLVVSDNGVGFPPEIYQEMQQKLHEEADDYSLTGIALVNINRRIHLYHGLGFGVSVSSKPGSGTTVTIRLPLIVDHEYF